MTDPAADDTRARVEQFRRKHRTGLVTLLFTDIVGSTGLKQRVGDAEGVALMQAHAQLVRDVLRPFPEAEEISTSGDSFFCAFVKPSDGVLFAVRLQAAMRAQFGASGLSLRIGVHVGEVVIEERPGARDLFGLQVDTAARVMSLAEAGQILCTRSVFDNARQVLKGRELEGLRPLVWLAHGPYVMKGVEDPVDVCEVGEEEAGVLRAPPASEKARPAGMSEEELGWRPSHGTKIPGTDWTLDERLGEGSFGEVWRAKHRHAKEVRVFKFCFLKERTRSLRRELALFRLIRERIGEHRNIVRLHEVHLDEAPYYLGIEYVSGRDLREWLAGRSLSIRAKLEIAAQAADGLAAAHEAGVIHQDLKPQNILVDESVPPLPSGAPVVKLCDFGVGRVVNAEVLSRITMTLGGLTMVGSTKSASESGSLLYMAPERLEGKGATPQSDLYSLGVVVFQMVAGNLDRAVTPDWEGEVPSVTLRDDLRRALSGTPARRFATAQEFARRLRSWTARRRARGVKWVAAAATLVVVSIGATWAILGSRLAAERARVERESGLRRQAEKSRQHAEVAEATAVRQSRKFQAEAELLKAERDLNGGNAMTALAHAIASVRVNPSPEAGDLAWSLRCRSARLLWTSPHASPGDPKYAGVRSVAFSPDASRIASGSSDSIVRFWNPQSGTEIARRQRHTSAVWSVAFSPDGKRDVSGSRNEGALLYDLSGDLIARLKVDTERVRSVAFSPDGERIALSDDMTVYLWDADGGTRIARLEGHSGTVNSVAFSPDGTHIASGADDNTVRFWNAESGNEIARLEGSASAVKSVAFSPDGRRIVAGAEDHSARVWEFESGWAMLIPGAREIARLQGHTDIVNSVAFSPDGKRIATGSADKSVRLWDAESGNEIARLHGHTGIVNSVTFSPDGKQIVSGAGDDAVRLWHFDRGNEIARLEGHTDPVIAVAFSPDGKQIVSGGRDHTIRIWDAERGNEIARLKGHTGVVNSVAFSPDGKRIVSGAMDNSVRIWDAERGREIARLEGHRIVVGPIDFVPESKRVSEVNSVAFSPNGEWVVSGADDKTVRLWDADSGREIARLAGHTGSVASVAFSPDGKRIVSGAGDDMTVYPASADMTVRLWDTESGREIARLEGHTDSVWSVAFSPDGKRIVLGSGDKTVRLWDVDSGDEIARFEGHTGRVASVAFSPDGKRIVSGSWDETIRLWDAESGREIASLEGHTGGVKSVAFSPDGKRIVSGSWDKTVRLWDAENGTEVMRMEGHTDWVTSVAFSADGKRTASQDGEGSVIIWDGTTGAQVRDLPESESKALFDEWEQLPGPKEHTRLPDQGAVIMEGEADWRTAWWDNETDAKTGLPKRLAAILDRWERDIGMRVNLETGDIERIPTPGPAYAGDPNVAARCK